MFLQIWQNSIENTFARATFLRRNDHVLIFCWSLPLLIKPDDTSFEFNMKNHSQDITKKISLSRYQFQQQLKLPSRKQTLLCNTCIEEK